MELTYTDSGYLSEGKVDVMVSLLLRFLTEPFGVKSVRFGIIIGVMVKSRHRYVHPSSFLQNSISSWDFIWLRTLAI
jgi:hypothetical protein